MAKDVDYNDYFQLGNPLTKVKSVISQRARNQMYALFSSLVQPSANDTVLDMGVTPDTSLPESNYFEKLYPYPQNITMSTIEEAKFLEQEFPGTRFVQNKAGERFPFEDKQFDILFCSAVLEHVGDDREQEFFVRECIRVAKKIYLATPDKAFPIEFHTYLPFVHYLPRPVHQKILRAVKMDFWAETANLNLLTQKRLYEMVPSGLRSRAKIHRNRLLGITTNLVLYVED